jgi:hypothetical protein
MPGLATNDANQSQQSGILLVVVRDGLLKPIVVAAQPPPGRHTSSARRTGFDVLYEGIGRSDSPRYLVLGLRYRSSAKSGMLACVH